MKKLLSIIATFILILVLIILYTNERTERKHFESEMNKWKSIAEIEQKTPSINKKAEQFVKSLNKGEHLKYLTGVALNEYETALKEGAESIDSELEHDETNIGLQDVKILLAHSESEKKTASSVVLYQIAYKGIFDSEETGVVDQRLLTLLMKINWVQTDDGMLVDRYSVELLEDNMSDTLSSEIEGSEGQ